MFRIIVTIFLLFFSKLIFGQSSLSLDPKIMYWDSIEASLSFSKKKSELQQILNQAIAYEDKKSISNCYRRLGIIYYEKGSIDTATRYFLKAASKSNEIGDFFSSASNYNQLGIIFYSLKSYSKSIDYFKKALKAYEKEGSWRGISDASNNIAESYGLLDSLQKMKEYLELSLDARIKSNDTSEIGYNYSGFGQYFLKKGYIDSSVKFFNLSISNFILNKDSFALIPAYNSLGKLYLDLKEFDKAIYYLKEVSESKYQAKNSFEYVDVLWSLSEAYYKSGDSKNAFKLLKKSYLLNDSLKKIEFQNSIANSETRYRTREKDSKITEQKQQIKLSNLRSVIISIVSLVIILIAVILLISYRNKRKAALKEAELQRTKIDDLLQKQEVENVNAMLKGQDEERKRIAQELHDRIGSILSTVKLHFSNVEDSIEALQAQQNQSYSEAVGLLDEAVDEVRRISHDLYEGSLAKFGFSTALRQLITAIEKANSIKIEFIENGITKNSYKNIEQDLYRITQELLSNTLKYANAKHIIIQVSQQNQTLTYMYEDDGKGFSPSQTDTSTGIGYKNIEARVAKINGKWFLDIQPNHGMTLTIEIALHHEKN